MLVAGAALRRAGARARFIEQVLVKVNGDIFTKTELEQRQVAVLRQRCSGQVDPETMKNDEQLKKALDEVTPQVLVDAVDELLLLQRGKELGLHAERRAVQGRSSTTSARNRSLEDDAEVPGRAEAGRHDDGRSAQAARAADAHRAGAAPGGRLEAVDHRGRGAAVLRRTPEEFTEPATVTLREILVEVPTTQSGQAAINVGARRRGAEEGRGRPRARADGGEDFAKVAGRSRRTRRRRPTAA